MKKNYHKTLIACYLGFITQAISANFAPLLFLTFHRTYHISLGKIAFISTVFFFTQLLVDLFCARYVDKIGYRRCVVASEILSACGLIGLAFLPNILPNAYAGILLSAMIYAAGSGLIEVLVSPIVEACPFDNKDSVMSLLHSFYCWGQMGVVLISTLFFSIFNIGNWKILAVLWSVVPIINAFVFMKAPFASLNEEGETGMSILELCKNKLFWILFVMMVCAGASEQGVSQWASAFAEKGLGVSKTVGDLAGPMAFACLMGISRAFYGKFGDKIELDKFMNISAVLCAASYLIISLVPNNAVSLIGCAVCGLSVGIMWPGSFSKASASIKRGGTALFALLALGGDLGCTAGPGLVGFISNRFNDNMKIGFFAGTIFPIVLLIAIYMCKKIKRND